MQGSTVEVDLPLGAAERLGVGVIGCMREGLRP